MQQSHYYFIAMGLALLVAFASQFGGGIVARVRSVASRFFRRSDVATPHDTRVARHAALCLWYDFAAGLDEEQQADVEGCLDCLAQYSIVGDA